MRDKLSVITCKRYISVLTILVVLGLIVFCNEESDEQNIVKATVNYEGSVVEIAQTYGDEYRLSNNLDTIKYIRNDELFQTLDYEHKCDVIEAVLRCEGRYLGLSQFDIVFEELPDTTKGQYNHASRTIVINAKMVRNGDMPGGTSEEILETCLHEAYHCYQHMLAEVYVDLAPEQRNLLVFHNLGVADWVENMCDYNYASDDVSDTIEYMYQPLEMDARAYAEKSVIEYYVAIDGLLEDAK